MPSFNLSVKQYRAIQEAAVRIGRLGKDHFPVGRPTNVEFKELSKPAIKDPASRLLTVLKTLPKKFRLPGYEGEFFVSPRYSSISGDQVNLSVHRVGDETNPFAIYSPEALAGELA